jgi:O-antigen/teichoic acid export membrane protein
VKSVGSQTPLSRHLLANALGRGWAFLSTFFFVPAYVYLLGVDGFGIVALYLAVSAVVALLDLGFSPTIARELHDQRRNVQEKLSLLRTYEVVYAAIISVLVVCALLLPTGAFSVFLSAEDLAKQWAADSIRLVLIAAVVQLLFFFYVAGLLGVEEQTKGNMVIVGAGIVRSALVLVPLWLMPTPSVYLLWQVAFALVFAVLARQVLYRALAQGASFSRPEFQRRLIAENLTFTGGMFLVSLTAAVNAQFDKLLIGRLIGMSALAEYSLVSMFAQLLVFLASPVTIAMLPRFVRSATSDNAADLGGLFAISYKLVGIIVSAGVGSIIFFGPYLVSLWTVGQVRSESVAPFVAPLVIGYALLALGTVPHSVAVANRNLRGSMAISATMLLTVPAYWLLIRQFGATGAAFTWLALQAVVVPAYTHWVNKRFVGMRNMGKALLVPALVMPLLISLGCNLLASFLVREGNVTAINLAIIVFAGLISLGGSALAALRRPDIDYLRGQVRPQLG